MHFSALITDVASSGLQMNLHHESNSMALDTQSGHNHTTLFRVDVVGILQQDTVVAHQDSTAPIPARTPPRTLHRGRLPGDSSGRGPVVPLGLGGEKAADQVADQV